MKSWLAITLVLVLSLVCCTTIALHGYSPLLYSPIYDSVTPAHTNPQVLEKVSTDRSALLAPVMSDLLDSPNTLVLNIRYQDLDLAKRDLREFRELTGDLNNLVINFNMSESEVEEFRVMNQKNLEIMAELLNGSIRLDELRSLEIRFRDEKDPTQLTSITYEGETLRNRMRELYREYHAQQGPMSAVGNDLSLNTSSYIESQKNFEEFIQEIEQEQETRRITLQTLAPDDNPYHLSVSVFPASSGYDDSLSVQGSLSGPRSGGVPIDIFIDAERVGAVTTGFEGDYHYTHLIRTLPAGTHTVFSVYSNRTFSAIETFSVLSRSTTITLEPPQMTDGQARCTGVLFMGERPVPGARVDVVADGSRRISLICGPEGRYEGRMGLAPGEHSLQAWFSPGPLPLFPSSSGIQRVIVPVAAPSRIPDTDGKTLPHFTLLASGLIIGLACAGSVWYLKRERGSKYAMRNAAYGNSARAESPEAVPGQEEVPQFRPHADRTVSQKTIMEGLQNQYASLAATNMAEAVRVLYLHLLSVIGTHTGLRNVLVCTPREICRKSKNFPFFVSFRQFICRYEEIRYSGHVPDEGQRRDLESSFAATVRGLEGEDH